MAASLTPGFPSLIPLGLWPLGSSWMLLWSLSALIPILLHLWSRRHRRETAWAAMRFLRVALEQHARRMRMEQWLLLLLRVSPLLLLGFALADPLAPWLNGAAASSQQVHHLMVIDATYSMGLRTQGTSFERAKAAARELISSARPGDGFTLVRMARSTEILMTEPVLDSQEALAEVDRIRLSADGASLTATASTVAKLVSDLKERSPHWMHQVVWLSDLTTATWSEVSNAECQSQFASIAELASQRLIDVGDGDADIQNLAVTQVAIKEPLAIVDQPLSVEVVVQSLGHTPGSEGQLKLMLDDREVSSRPLRIPPLGTQTVSFPFSVAEAGDHCLQLELEDDDLMIDNQRHHCFRARQRVRSLIVEGRAGEGRLIALAIRPTDDSRNDVEVAAETALVERELTQYDCVWLANVGRLGETEAAQLTRYLQAGGALVIFLGDQVQADGYNSRFIDSVRSRSGATVRSQTLLPARIEQPRTASQGLDPRDYSHPIVEVFQGHEQAGLRVTPVYRYFELTPMEGSRRVIDLTDGTPFFIERSFGDGKCLLVATAASPQSTFVGPDGETPWTELSAWPSFLPLIQQTLLYVTRNESPRRNRLVGEPLRGYFVSTSEAQLTTPEGAEHRLTLNGDQWVYDNTSTPGNYRIEPLGANSATQLRSVNIDVAESTLSRLAPARLPSSLPLEAPAGAAAGNAGAARIFRWILAVVFCLLLAECWLSNRYLVSRRPVPRS